MEQKQLSEKGGKADNGAWIPKYRFDCINVSLKDHKELVKSQTVQIASLQEKVGALENRLTQLDWTEKENCLYGLLSNYHFKSICAARAFFTIEQVELDKLTDYVKTRVKQLKKEEPFLFWDEETHFMLIPERQFKRTEKKDE